MAKLEGQGDSDLLSQVTLRSLRKVSWNASVCPLPIDLLDSNARPAKPFIKKQIFIPNLSFYEGKLRL